MHQQGIGAALNAIRIEAKKISQAPVWIKINEENAALVSRQYDTEIQDSRRLAHPTLLIGYSQDSRHTAANNLLGSHVIIP
jgi:hypothetical protein